MPTPTSDGTEIWQGLHVTPLCEQDSSATPPGMDDGDWPVVTDPDRQLERTLRRVLQNLPGVTFESLVIRRVPSGVCLQGYAIIDDGDLDLGMIAQGIDGVGDVLDRVVAIRRTSLPPR